MKIKKYFDYDADWDEIADEFISHDSGYQTQVLNLIGAAFKNWSKDKTRPLSYIQLLEIAEGLDDNGRWFVDILHDYMIREETDNYFRGAQQEI